MAAFPRGSFRPVVLTCGVAGILLFGTMRAERRADPQTGTRPPNFVVILTDDQGYGDLGVYGHPTIRTPRIDRMAAEGQRWTSFYAAPVCTPSRAQLMTGRLAIRSGTASGVFFPNSTGGLQSSEITIAEVLKPRGYATGVVGKWHLGHLAEYLPTAQGFDSYFGIPYSNDMAAVGIARIPGSQRFANPQPAQFNVPIMRNIAVVEQPADQRTITRRYTDEAIAFIRQHRERPFFLYLAHSLPHVPLFVSKEFEGRSARGTYGDVIEEIDHNLGRILDTLRELQLDRNTLVLFTSDNGPWLPYLDQGGSAGLLRSGKGTTWEGGVRVPAIFWWPGTIAAGGVVTGIGSELDVLPTLARLAGAEAPKDRVLDGYDLSATLRGAKTPSPRETLFYYRAATLSGVRHRSFKLHKDAPATGRGQAAGADPAEPAWELYDLDVDPSEKIDLAKERPEVVAELLKHLDAHKKSVVPVEDQIPKGRGRGGGS
jgi:arylsulfatase A-like enzyme